MTAPQPSTTPDDGRTPDKLADPTAADRQFAVDAPTQSAFDQAIPVRIRGARPGGAVEVKASAIDAGGGEWSSTATFRADERGVVELTEQAPRSGSYDGVRPMGWLWSMSSADRRVTALMTPDAVEVTIRAVCDGPSVDRTITRTVSGAGVTRHEVRSGQVAGTAFEPAGPGPHPGVLVLHGSGGSPARFRAALLASHGFATLALRYFGDADPIPDSIKGVPLAYFDDAADWFTSQAHVADDQLGVLGHSWGGLAGLLLGARADWVGAVVSYAGSGVVWDTPQGPPAWIDRDGRPVPFLSGQRRRTLREGQLDEYDADRRRAATIAVEDIDGPVLLLSGSEDSVWPARRLCTIAADRLRRADFDHDFEHVSYEDAGHFITPPYLPKRSPVFGGSAGGTARADADAWPVALSYLRRGLSDGGTSPD